MSVDQEKSIFLAAIDIADGPEREAYVAQMCEANPDLRLAVNELLAAHLQDASIELTDDLGVKLQHQVRSAVRQMNLDSTQNSGNTPLESANRVDEVVGNYRLMEKIGEGGFGEVFVAQQLRPVERRVALKLLKPGMDSREVIARFEAERQALALMDHPNIAQVFDAGTTEHGQPYVVMELVRGVPITDFCRQYRLSTEDRLDLFTTVCHAVQHAHQKGVIHRDLKPSNVLVTLHDATPVAKVIDFGVAKALDGPLTEKTIYTRFAQMIGTPMYMSPEQAEMNAIDVDTRSDIYSLGVLLYELLTETTPFDKQMLHSASFDEMRRIIREDRPQRPSIRLTELSKQRRPHDVDTSTHAGELRGDLDWIVMKALEKDRKRRYDTAADFARDVIRFLERQPVLARAPSTSYQVQKFIDRNRVAIATISLVFASLVTGTAISIWQAVRATQAQEEAETLRNEALEFADRLKNANVLLDSARANADEQRYDQALAQYTKATELQPDHYLTWSGRGSLYTRLGAWRLAAADYGKALDLGAPANNPSWWGVAQLMLYADREHDYESICKSLENQIENSDDPAMVSLAVRCLLLEPGDEELAKELAQKMDQILVQRREDLEHRGGVGPGDMRPPPPPELPRFSRGQFPRFNLPVELILYSAGLAYFRAGDTELAIELLEEVTADHKFEGRFMAWPVLAMAYQQVGRTEEARSALDKTNAVLERWTAGLLGDNEKPGMVPWFDVVECELLYREAYALLNGRQVEEDRLAVVERQALHVLRHDE